jgi:hypothetical protein
MKHPKCRRIRFDRNEMVPFQWDPANPLPGLWGSAVALLMVCWEKYISAEFHDALDSVENPDVPVAHQDEYAGLNRKLLCVRSGPLPWRLRCWRGRVVRGPAPTTGGTPARRAERSCGEL